MKNTTKRFTRKIAAVLAAVTAMSAMTAVTSSASDAENEEIIAAAKANPDLRVTWEDVDNNDGNEDEIDRVSDLLERLDIDGDIYNGKDANEYDGKAGKLTHEQVLEVISSAHPDGCIRNPYSIDYSSFDIDDDDDDEPVFTEDDWNDAEEDDGSDSIFNLNFGDGFMDELLEKML